MNRRSLASLLVGVIAIMAGMWAGTAYRTDWCLDSGGRWDVARRACAMATGAAPEPARVTMTSYAITAIVALLLGTMLWRLFLAVSTGKLLRPPR
jgi:hypothetical protein